MDGDRIAALDRRGPEVAGAARIDLGGAAEMAVDVDEARPGDDPLDRGAAVAGDDGVGERLLLGIERREADMGGLGLDDGDPAGAPRQQRHAEAGARPDDADHALLGELLRAGDRRQLVLAEHRDGMGDRAMIVEQGQLLEAELVGEGRARDPPVAVHEAQGLALDRRRDGDRGGRRRQRLARLLRELARRGGGERPGYSRVR